MAAFPTLSTGAIVQHPLASAYRTGTEVIRFLDGLDQRCLTMSGPLQMWTIKLDQLTDQEMATLEQFFIDVEGSYGTFSFTDPNSSIAFPACRFQTCTLATTYQAIGRGTTEVVVVEIRA